MRSPRLLAAVIVLTLLRPLSAGTIAAPHESSAASAPAFDLSLESAYLLGIFGNPHGYEVNANFLTARLRWGDFTDRPGILRGYNQFYLTAEAQPIIRGVENRYFGINLGVRYNFGRLGSRITPYFSGGLGLGFIDSNADNFGAQGQDFTFNILTAAGISYKFTDQLSGQIGLLYEHFSNAGLTDPNPSLNLLGPQLGFTYSF